MKRIAFLALVVGGMIFGSIPARADADGPAENAPNLRRHQWQDRVLLIFAGSDNDAAYQRQQRLMDGYGAGMAERDMVIGALTDETGGVLDTTALSPNAVTTLRKQFGLRAGEFAVVLIGKDGGVKLQRAEPVKPSTLFTLIDGMPMRQAEVRGSR